MRLLLLALLTVLSACGRQGETADSASEPVAHAPSAEAAATDQLGAFSAQINGVAFWNHPSIPFNGLVLAAGEDGLVALNIEDGAEVARVSGVSLSGVDVAYAGQGAGAQGYAVVSMTEKNSSDRGFRVYAIDNETRALTQIPSMFIAEGESGRAFCLGRGEAGEIVVHQMTSRGASSRSLTIVERMTTSGDAKRVDFKGGFVACAGDRLDGAVFAINEGGDIYRIDDSGKLGEKPFARSGVANAAGMGLAFNGLVEGGDTAQCCGQLAVLDGETGAVHLFDRDDGRPIGVITMSASFDVEAVGAASAMGLGSGNFGAVYRDGALALASDGETASLRLTPLNAVMDAFAAPLGPAASLRDLNPQPEEDALDFSVEPPSP